MSYDSLIPQQLDGYSGDLLLTTSSETTKLDKIPALYEDILDLEPTVIRGLIMQKLYSRCFSEELLIGIDPGKRMGLSIYYYEREIEHSFYISMEDLVSHLIRIFVGLNAKRKIVKIGNGDKKLAEKIANMLNLKYCSDFEIQFVDEHKTSLKIKNYNQRGKRDMLSARSITQREGSKFLVLPLSRT